MLEACIPVSGESVYLMQRQCECTERERDRQLEDELRDPSNFAEFFVPRPLRLTLLGFGAFSCLTGTFVAFSNVATDTSLIIGEGPLNNLVINLFGFVIFSTLFWLDRSGAERRVSKRKQIREAQIEFGDREVYVNKEGEKMSKLKEVDDDWILRRLERWGRRDRMPFVGPEKGAILQSLVKEKRPKLVVEVGTLCGYSAILIAQVLPPGSRLWTYEVDWKWVLVAKRFLWQASQGSKNAALAETISDKVDVRWGDARKKMAELEEDRIDMLFLDGIPNQYIEYLKAAEDRLAHGALVVADNAGVFADGGLKEYLQYVRNSPKYESSFVESVYEWSNVPDGLEVSEFIG
ncbi:unnamed protein product [Ostreobium quekettii]|uniref:catechol O-methyltransferase n=1 Tax=Ostreobium quekettii TaxID=121088 RepID=A0A8S1J8G3_9CHLO|nr:unnamed protein product [Ostreobium quekettii]